MKTLIFCLIIFSFYGVSFAEMRTWIDISGSRYEGEFVRELFDKITVRDAQGKETRLSVEDLSEHDQRYLRVKIPPQVEISFLRNTRLLPLPWDLWYEDSAQMNEISGKVTVQKISKRPFTSHLSAEIYLIATEKDGDNYILLSKNDSSVLFSEDNENQHTFKVDPVITRVYTEFNGIQRRGEEYRGYLIVILDANGNTISTKTDIPGEWVTNPETIVNLRELAVWGAASIRSRHFDKTGRKTDVTRPKFYVPPTR